MLFPTLFSVKARVTRKIGPCLLVFYSCMTIFSCYEIKRLKNKKNFYCGRFDDLCKV